MADEALPLQFLKRDRHTGSPHAQHDRQELVRERDLVAVYAVVGHQQPARQTLIDRTATVCQGGLRGLDHETVDGSLQCLTSALEPGTGSSRSGLPEGGTSNQTPFDSEE